MAAKLSRKQTSCTFTRPRLSAAFGFAIVFVLVFVLVFAILFVLVRNKQVVLPHVHAPQAPQFKTVDSLFSISPNFLTKLQTFTFATCAPKEEEKLAPERDSNPLSLVLVTVVKRTI